MDDSNWFFHLGVGDNPYKGLKVEECICKHGVCNCEREACELGKPRDPEYDYCGKCVREADHALDDLVLTE